MANAEYTPRPDDIEVSTGADLIPVTVGANGEASLEVVERTPVRRTVGFGPVALSAVLLYLEGGAVDQVQEPRLREVARISEQLTAVQRTLEDAQRRRTELQQVATQTRQNLEAVREHSRAADLRQRLTRRLGELDREIVELTSVIVEAQAEVSELVVRQQEAVAEIELSIEVPAE